MITGEMICEALRYESLGWSVLPLCPHDHVGVGKVHMKTCGSPGKRPFYPAGQSGDWKEFQSRRASPEEIRGYWDKHPGLNVGAAMGPVSGVVGIDIDSAEGEELLSALSGGDLPETWEYTTGKGRRLLYRLPPGREVRTQSFSDAAGREAVRLMGAGTQVVLPPSVHPQTRQPYRWLPGRSPWDGEIADAPAWLLAAPAAETPSPPKDEDAIPEGGRNNYLTRLGGAMRRVGADREAIRAALVSMNDRRMDPSLSAAEVDSVARSVCRYPVSDDPTAVFGDSSGNVWSLKWASQLSDYSAETEWLWRGYIPAGGITLLSALWKAGKTTLLSSLLREIGNGGEFLGQPISPGKVLYVTEEMEKHWSRRREDFGVGDWAAFHVQPFDTKPSRERWEAFIGQLVKDVKTHGFKLVVFDTLSDLWPVQKENDAGEVQAALAPLRQLPKAGAAILLVHHLRKGGGAEFTGSRGSGVICSFPDIIVNMERDNGSGKDNHRRKLVSKGRYEETPEELVMEWDRTSKRFSLCSQEGGSEGEAEDAGHDRRRRRLLHVLPADPAKALTRHSIQKAMLEFFGAGLGKSEKQEAYLTERIADGDILMIADGERAYYRVADAPPLAPGDVIPPEKRKQR